MNSSQKGQVKQAAAVIILTMLAWMGVSLLGGRLGLPVRYAFLADFAALAAFIWATIVLLKVWRASQRNEE